MGADSDGVVRVWLRDDPALPGRADWHVSVGSYAPFQLLLGFVQPGSLHDIGGMGWDEALATLAQVLIPPGASRGLMRFLEPPLSGGWNLVLELVPHSLGVWRVSSRDRTWRELELGEALATFVHETFPRDWRGFGIAELRRAVSILRRQEAGDPC